MEEAEQGVVGGGPADAAAHGAHAPRLPRPGLCRLLLPVVAMRRPNPLDRYCQGGAGRRILHQGRGKSFGAPTVTVLHG